METENTQGILAAAAQETLETMFFTCPEPRNTPPEADPARWSAMVAFHGVHQGRFTLTLPESCARSIAANFKGEFDSAEITEDDARQVVCELANMVCGCALSRLAPDAEFNLDPPCSIDMQEGRGPSGIEAWFDLEEGNLGAILELEAA